MDRTRLGYTIVRQKSHHWLTIHKSRIASKY